VRGGFSRRPARASLYQLSFTEELEDGASVYYFDGYNATVEWASVARIEEG